MMKEIQVQGIGENPENGIKRNAQVGTDELEVKIPQTSVGSQGDVGVELGSVGLQQQTGLDSDLSARVQTPSP